MSEKQGRYIVIDGPNGLGKSTLIANAENRLFEEGKSVYTDREPGGRGIGEVLREILKTNSYNTNDRTDFFLFAAARAALADIVKQEVSKNDYVFIDRSWLSSMAFQVHRGSLLSSGNFTKDDFRLAQQIAIDEFPPAEYVVLDGSYLIVQSRASKQSEPDKWETGALHHEQDRVAFKHEAGLLGNAVLGIIDSDQTKEEMLDEFLRLLGEQ